MGKSLFYRWFQYIVGPVGLAVCCGCGQNEGAPAQQSSGFVQLVAWAPPEPTPAPPRPRLTRSPVAPAVTEEFTGESPAEQTVKANGKKVGHPAKPHQEQQEELAPLFVGWEKPQAILVLTGEQNGYIEPCGCAGLENMKGGLGRRHHLLTELQGKGWPLAAFDVGGQIHRTGPQSEVKFTSTVSALQTMQYSGVALGAKDLKLPTGDLVSLAADPKSAFVSANVGLFGLDSGLTPKFRVIKVGQRKIGVTSILGLEYQKQLNSTDLEFADPAKALREVLPKLKQQADFLILLSHATQAESEALAKAFPDFQAVVTADSKPVQPAEAKRIGETYFLEVGQKSMHVTVLGLFDDAQQPVRYQRVPLDRRYQVTASMKQMMTEYQEHLRLRGFDGLGLKPLPVSGGRKFVGSQACADCHTKANEIWKATPHAHAIDTLVKLEPARHFDPECLSCHVVGWRPQQFDILASGYLSLEKTPHLVGVGCESCHGPGSAHVAAENGDVDVTQDQLLKLRSQMILTYEQAERHCLQCHDLDNSPSFNFKNYWPHVEHKGKD